MTPPLLILTTEPPPLPGIPATGAGMRAWGLANGLRAAGFADVTLAFAADAIRGREAPPAIFPWVTTVERGAIDDLIRQRRPGAVVFQHWGMVSAMREDPGCPVAIDLAGPHLLERALWGSRDRAGDLREKLAALARADFVTCSGAFQRNYFLSFLVQSGHDPRAPHLCPVIPFSLSPELPELLLDRDPATFFHGGMFLPWQDPELLLRTTLRAMDEAGSGRLIFVGGPHPSGDVSGGRFDGLLDLVSRHPRVERHGLMPFDAMLGLMRRSSVALDLLPRNAERELAFPTRTVTYLWAGLPVVHNDYDELAGPVASERAGWTLDATDEAALASLLGRLLRRGGESARRAENAQKLVRERYTWDRTIGPLAEWCTDPRPRAKKATMPVAAAPTAPDPVAGNTPAVAPPPRVTYGPRPATTGRNPLEWVLAPVVVLIALPLAMALALLFGLVEIVRVVFFRVRTGPPK